MADHQTTEITPSQLSYSANTGHPAKAEGREKRVRQSICAACGKTVRPGGGIVLQFGAAGRVHKECFKTPQNPA